MAPIAGHKRSKVWNYFSDKGACKYCAKTIKHIRVSNLWRHVRVLHKSEMVNESQESIPDVDVRMQEVESELAVYTSGHHHHHHHGSTSRPKNMRPALPSPSAWSHSTVSDASPIAASFAQEGRRSKPITDALMFMIVKDNLSTTQGEGIGFKHFMKTISRRYTIPDRKTLRCKLDKKFEAAIAAKRGLLSRVTDLALTIDIWTDVMNTDSLIGFTGHFVHDFQRKSELLGVKPVSEFRSRKHIRQQMNSVLADWGLSMKNVIACVSDSASKVTKEIIETFSPGRQLPCFAHELHLVVREVLHEDVSLDVALIVERVKAIVTFFRQNVVAADVLRNHQKHADIRPLNLRLDQGWDCRRRWKSCFLMLERFVEISEHVATVLVVCNDAPQMLGEQELCISKDVLKLLRPFLVITDEIRKKEFTSRTLLIPLIFCLKCELSSISVDTDSGRAFKDKLIGLLNSRFANVESNSLNCLATLLDPRFKNVSFENSGCCGKAINLLDREMKSLSEVMPNEDVDSPSRESKDLQSLWKFHDERSANLSLNQTFQPGLAAVVKQYLSTPTIPRSSDPLGFWQQNQFVYPALFKLAMKHLCIPASQVQSSERLFAKSGNVVTKRESNIDESRVEKMIMIGSMSLEEWGKLN